MMSGKRRSQERVCLPLRYCCHIVTLCMVTLLLVQDEGESGEEDEEDDGFFVPHGYLSDGEGETSDGEVTCPCVAVLFMACLCSRVVNKKKDMITRSRWRRLKHGKLSMLASANH